MMLCYTIWINWINWIIIKYDQCPLLQRVIHCGGADFLSLRLRYEAALEPLPYSSSSELAKRQSGMLDCSIVSAP